MYETVNSIDYIGPVQIHFNFVIFDNSPVDVIESKIESAFYDFCGYDSSIQLTLSEIDDHFEASVLIWRIDAEKYDSLEEFVQKLEIKTSTWSSFDFIRVIKNTIDVEIMSESLNSFGAIGEFWNQTEAVDSVKNLMQLGIMLQVEFFIGRRLQPRAFEDSIIAKLSQKLHLHYENSTDFRIVNRIQLRSSSSSLIDLSCVIGVSFQELSDIEKLETDVSNFVEDNAAVKARVRKVEVDYAPELDELESFEEVSTQFYHKSVHTTPETYLLENPGTEIEFSIYLALEGSSDEKFEMVARYLKTQLLVKLNLIHGSNTTDIFYYLSNQGSFTLCEFEVKMHLEFGVYDIFAEKAKVREVALDALKAEKIYLISFFVTTIRDFELTEISVMVYEEPTTTENPTTNEQTTQSVAIETIPTISYRSLARTKTDRERPKSVVAVKGRLQVRYPYHSVKKLPISTVQQTLTNVFKKSFNDFLYLEISASNSNIQFPVTFAFLPETRLLSSDLERKIRETLSSKLGISIKMVLNSSSQYLKYKIYILVFYPNEILFSAYEHRMPEEKFHNS